LNDWLNKHFISVLDKMCLSSDAHLAGWLDQDAIKKLRKRSLGEIPRQDLYALVILELWLRRSSLTLN